MQQEDIEANHDVLPTINNLAVGQTVNITYHRMDYYSRTLDIEDTATTIRGKVVSHETGVGRMYPVLELEYPIETPEGPSDTAAITPVEQAPIHSYEEGQEASYNDWTVGYIVELEVVA